MQIIKPIINNQIFGKTILFLKLGMFFLCVCLLFLLYIAWPWAPLCRDDTLSTLMVHDGIKALSGGHSRCSEPRPRVALNGRRAVIHVPHCQSWPPPPSLKKPIHLPHQQGQDECKACTFLSSTGTPSHTPWVLMWDTWQKKTKQKTQKQWLN